MNAKHETETANRIGSSAVLGQTNNNKSMQLETINRLYLELSQVATVDTAKEIKLRHGIGDARQQAHALCWQIEKCGASQDLTQASIMASALQSQLNELLA